tara:strand:- start:156 stop:659 length:504 start_codon:yes stop_codon:yes gene_type:complete
LTYSQFHNRHVDFNESVRERNWQIHKMSREEKRRLNWIGLQYDLTRERVRQICQEGDAILSLRADLTFAHQRKARAKMKYLNVDRRTLNILKRLRCLNMTVAKFVENYTHRVLLNQVGFGPACLVGLMDAIMEIDEDVSNIWAARNREDNDASKHGGRRSYIRNRSK